MTTTGLVVLADSWNNGWRAYVDGQPAAILRANHALRGVVVAAGSQTLEFRYEPASFKWGVCSAAAGTFLLLGWLVVPTLGGSMRLPRPKPPKGGTTNCGTTNGTS